MKKVFILLFVSTLTFAQKDGSFNFKNLQKQGELKAINRQIEVIEDFIRVSESTGEGLIWLPIKDFKNGEIEIEMRGKDVLQKSFIGIAFHRLNDSTFDAVYCRPFNFFAKDSIRKIHAIQYVSHPIFTWKKLRNEQNGKFEKEIINPPNPNGWFKVRLDIDNTTIKAYINQDTKPSLVVEKLTTQTNGKLGIFVGEGSGGDFKSIVIKTKK